MFEDLPESVELMLCVDVSADEVNALGNRNMTSVCISYDSTVVDCRFPGRCDLGFQNVDDFRLISSKRADLVFFGSQTSAFVMGMVVARFFRDGGIIVVVSGSTSVSAREISSRCDLGCVLTLRRLPGALALCYDVGADLAARVSANLVREVFEALGRVVVGAEVVVKGRFRKPEGVVGPYVIVAEVGAEFGSGSTADDRDLVAVDLSASGIQTLSESVFRGCFQLAAVAFPPELTSIGKQCFAACDALRVVDLSATKLRTLGSWVFLGCGAKRVSVPVSLRVIGVGCFSALQLKVLDLRACAGVVVRGCAECEVTELYLPRQGFAEAVMAFLPFSHIEGIEADVDEKEVTELQAQLDEWGIDKLRWSSPGQAVRLLLGSPRLAVPVHLTDPVALSTATAVTMTAWRQIPHGEWKFVRSLDLSGLAVESLPAEATVHAMVWLERAILPVRMRVLPSDFFMGCSRLTFVGTGGCVALEGIEVDACGWCKSLAAFEFPPTVRIVSNAFLGTAMTRIDLSETAAESADFGGLLFLEELLLPRRCALKTAFALPSLRRLSFGASGGYFGCHPAEVRFESMAADAEFAPGLAEARLYAEVACELGLETLPSPPP